MAKEKVAIYDVTKVQIDSRGNTITQIYFSGKFDEIVSMIKSMTDGKFILVAPRIAKASKNDPNKAKSEENQSLCSVSMNDNEIIISADLANMNSYASSVPQQGSGKWVGILVNVGEPTIIGTSYNGYEFTQTDVQEADDCGGTAGEFILWLKAEVVESEPKVFTLSRSGVEREITIKVVDISK